MYGTAVVQAMIAKRGGVQLSSQSRAEFLQLGSPADLELRNWSYVGLSSALVVIIPLSLNIQR